MTQYKHFHTIWLWLCSTVNSQYLRKKNFISHSYSRCSTVVHSTVGHTFNIPFTSLHDAPVSIFSLRPYLQGTTSASNSVVSLHEVTFSWAGLHENNFQYDSVKHSQPLGTHSVTHTLMWALCQSIMLILGVLTLIHILIINLKVTWKLKVYDDAAIGSYLQLCLSHCTLAQTPTG